MIRIDYDDSTIDTVSIEKIVTLYEGHISDAIDMTIISTPSSVTAKSRNRAATVGVIEKSKTKTAKLAVYLLLQKLTGITLPWGDMTGVKPLKKFAQISDAQDIESAQKFFRSSYAVSEEKISLLRETLSHQTKYYFPKANTAALYVHIPLCVSKCTYCSFPSRITTMGSALCEEYLNALLYELDVLRLFIQDKKIEIDCVYVGGGTPSILSIDQIERLLAQINRIVPQAKEITFEAGRYDTLSIEKLQALYRGGVDRISLNPQTSNDDTLQRIERGGDFAGFVKCYEQARNVGFEKINCDLIFGLENETEKDFIKSLTDIADLSPANITLHTLACKRTAKTELIDIFDHPINISSFLDKAREILKKHNYYPYYLYKQQYAVSGAENVGYTLSERECIYNIRMMGDTQTILSTGANATTKILDPKTGDYKNIYTLKDIPLYISKIEEITEKKMSKIDRWQNILKNKYLG